MPAIVKCGEEPDAGMAAKWVSAIDVSADVKNSLGRACLTRECQQWLRLLRCMGRTWGKCQQWLHAERTLLGEPVCQVVRSQKWLQG